MRILVDLRITNITVTNTLSETTIINNKYATSFANDFKTRFTYFDNDDTGIECSSIYRSKFEFQSINPYVDNNIVVEKDITDYCKINGYNKTKELFNNIYNKQIWTNTNSIK
jgi:hypothetical protein